AGGIDPLLVPGQAVVMCAADDEIGLAVAVHVVDEDGHAGHAQFEFRMPGPLAGPGVFGGFEPAVRPDEIAPAVAVDVAEAQPVADAALFENVLRERAGTLAFRIDVEAVDDNVAAGVGAGLRSAVAVHIPETGCFDVTT